MIYREIPGFEGLYQVSRCGKVVALTRMVEMPNGGHKVIKRHHPKQSVTYKGYLKVMLTNGKSERKGRFVHRLVMLAFVGKSKLQVHHKDGNKQNNNLENLEYVTNRQNTSARFDKTKTSSKYTGVTWTGRKWQATKKINGKPTYLGVYEIEEDAQKAYLMERKLY